MRLLALALTGILTTGPVFAQAGQSTPPPSSADDGRAIRNDCDLCHGLLAQDDPAPPILKQLGE